MAEDAVVLRDVQAHVGTLTLNRPERLNALGSDMREKLFDGLRAMAEDDDVRVVMITGAGRGFCSGGDVKEMSQRRAGGQGFSGQVEARPIRDRILLFMREMPKPIIAAVNGVAAGAGMNLALAADLRIASDKASFSQAFIKRGLHPDWGGTYLLPRLVGTAKAAELIFYGDMVSAADALQLGLVNRVAPEAEFAEEARDWAERLAQGPPIALALAKRGIYRNATNDLASALEYETLAQQTAWSSEDAGEGIKAFVEKRPPQFKGK